MSTLLIFESGVKACSFVGGGNPTGQYRLCITTLAFPRIAKHQQVFNLQGQSELQIDLDLLMHLLNLLASQFWSLGFLAWNPFFLGQYETPACI